MNPEVSGAWAEDDLYMLHRVLLSFLFSFSVPSSTWLNSQARFQERKQKCYGMLHGKGNDTGLATAKQAKALKSPTAAYYTAPIHTRWSEPKQLKYHCVAMLKQLQFLWIVIQGVGDINIFGYITYNTGIYAIKQRSPCPIVQSTVPKHHYYLNPHCVETTLLLTTWHGEIQNTAQDTISKVFLQCLPQSSP